VFNASIDDTWHVYGLSVPEGGPLAAEFNFVKTSDFEFIGKITQSKPVKEFDKVFEMNVEYFSHKAIFTQRIKLKTDKKLIFKESIDFRHVLMRNVYFPQRMILNFKYKAHLPA